MLCDERKEVRYLAYQRISTARAAQNVTPRIVRRFTKPKLNIKAKTYHELIDWDKIDVTEPPLTKKFTDEQLQLLVKDGQNSDFMKADVFQLQCHTQSVERCVKLVTEASIKVSDDLRRDGFIRTVFQSRELMPTFMILVHNLSICNNKI